MEVRYVINEYYNKINHFFPLFLQCFNFKRLLTKEQMSMLKVNEKQVVISMWKQL
jgi:hypothetical protein